MPALALLGAALCAGAVSARPNLAGVFAETTAPPTITKQPVSKTATAGKAVTFEATASGKPAPTVQWELSRDGGGTWSAIEGAATTKYAIAAVSSSENGYQFRATFKNSVGEATTAAATLTVNYLPAVTLQPTSVTVEEGQSAAFTATASGNPAPTVQWQLSTNGGGAWSNISGANAETLTIAGTTSSLSGHEYRAVFTNSVGKATSEGATLTVQKAPAITRQPASLTVLEGDSAGFEATASGFPTPSVQWEVSTDGGLTWAAIAGATAARYTIAAASLSESGEELRATFTNAAGSASSSAATLTVEAPPVVTVNPDSTTVETGEAVRFEAAATGRPAPTVQWEASSDGGTSWSAIEGATADTLTIAQAQPSESGRELRATFTNAGGKATTSIAILTVSATNYGAVAWGANTLRQLGDGSAAALSDVPVPVSDLSFVTAIAAGGSHSLALLADGSVMAWGSNAFGQLGDGSELTPSAPVAVSGLSGVRAVAAGADHSLALLSNGTVMAWGENEDGQLGNASTSESDVPVAVKGLSGVRAIAAGGNDSYALLSNGTVMAWGDDELGELGDGSTKLLSNVPVAVKKITGATAVAAGGNFALALLAGGTVQAWGGNAFGQLAGGSAEESSNVPVAAGGLSGVSAIAAGSRHALALLAGGTVKAWGEGTDGQLGDGAFPLKQEAPTEVAGLSGVVAVSAGTGDSAALLGDGSVETWGLNSTGQLGNGSTGGPLASPVTVEGIREAQGISAGGAHVVAYGEPIPSVSGLSPASGTSAGGTSVTIGGRNFRAGASVELGGVEASSVTVNSETSITATAPPGSGTVDVSVSTPAGTSPPVGADRYTYVPPPTIVKLAPRTGTAAGATTVTITGTSFVGVSAVRFGALAASGFVVNSSTSITAVTPAEAAGAVRVSVTTESGTTPATTGDLYKFAPVIASLSPNTGPTAGGTSVTVTGVGFAPGSTATKFKFGAASVKAVSCASSTVCTVLAPAHEAGTVEVRAIVNKVASLKNPAGDDYAYG